jgi:hypothetical protein
MTDSSLRISGHTVPVITPEDQTIGSDCDFLVQALAVVDIEKSSKSCLINVPKSDNVDVEAKQLDSGSSFCHGREQMNTSIECMMKMGSILLTQSSSSPSKDISRDISMQSATQLFRSRSESPSRERSKHTDKLSRVKRTKMQRSISLPDMESSREHYNRAVGHILGKSGENDSGKEDMVKQITKQSFTILDKLLEDL